MPKYIFFAFYHVTSSIEIIYSSRIAAWMTVRDGDIIAYNKSCAVVYIHILYTIAHKSSNTLSSLKSKGTTTCIIPTYKKSSYSF